MIAIQWFIFQEDNIYKLNKNSQNVMKSYNLILNGIRQLLKSCLIYIRTDSFKCLYILQITASLSKVIFSFHMVNGERFIKYDLQMEFLNICDELKQQIEIEKNDLIQSQMELYLFLTKTSFEIAPNNSNKKNEILKGCLSGIIGSIIQMKPNAELLESLFQGASLLYKMHVVNKNRKQYEVYFQIDMLQWEIINYFKNEQQQSLEELILQIEAIYDNVVNNSNIWRYHYLWMQMIGKILIYNPLITKHKLYQLTKTFNFGPKPSQIWKEYQNKGILIQMNYSNDQALILLNQLQNKQLLEIDRLLLEDCFKEWEKFLLLKDFLINEQYHNIPFTFGSYLRGKLKIGRNEPQQNEDTLAIDNIKKFLDLMIPNKLLTLITQNEEKLEEVIKIYRNFRKENSCNDRISQQASYQQIKRLISKLEEYFLNAQDILKIMRFNQSKQKKSYDNNNFENLNNLLRIQEIIQLYIYLDQRNREQKQNFNDDNDRLQEWKKILQEELKLIDLKEYKFYFFNFPQPTPQRFREICKREIDKLEMDQLQNNLPQYFKNLLTNLDIYYENKNNDILMDFDQFNLHLKEVMMISYQVEIVSSTEDLKKLKQSFAKIHLHNFLESLMLLNLRLKLKLVAQKKSLYNLLEKAESKELQQLQEIINLDMYLRNVINDFPFKIIRDSNNFDNSAIAELKNISITEEDFANKLSKQKGIINYLIFQISLEEKLINSELSDLEQIEKEFGELFLEESPTSSIERFKQIIESLQINESIKNATDTQFNSSKLHVEEEKYQKFLNELIKFQNFSQNQNINNFQINQIINSTAIILETLRNSHSQKIEIFIIPIKAELRDLHSKIEEYKKLLLLQEEDQKRQREDITKQNYYEVENHNTLNQNEQQLENCLDCGDQGKINQKLKCNLTPKTNFSIIVKLITLQKKIIIKKRQVLEKLLLESNQFSCVFDFIRKKKQEIQLEMQQSFLQCFQNLISYFEKLSLTTVNLQKQENENFQIYLERIFINISNTLERAQDEKYYQNNIVSTQANIYNFLNSLKLKLRDNFIENQLFSQEIQMESQNLIYQIKKVYLQGNVKEEEGDEIELNQPPRLMDNLIKKYQDFLNNDEWKIKQGVVFTIIQISSNCFASTTISFCQNALIQLWKQEKDQRVRNLLKSQDFISMQIQILQKDWQTQNKRIAVEMQQMLTRIDELQEQISQEVNLNNRDKLLKEMDETTSQLDEYIENISEMGQSLRLITDFIKQIRKDLKRVEVKINEIKKQLNSMSNDIKFLRGKSVEQLFEIRKWKVLKGAAYQNIKSIFIPLQTQEIYYKGEKWERKEEDKSSILMNLEQINDTEGQVNQFILEEKQTVLLIHGVAGSGKSTTAKKIEEYIWKLHDNNKKISNQVLIPIYISLPSIKNPVFQVVEEALHQDEYGFDELQLKECKEKLEKKEFRFLLIMDSYDEMKLENIQKNLYINNKIKQNWSNPLVIFTTRSEIFTSINYALWFAPDDKEKLKEIQLQKFDSKQMKEYLQKFTMQSIKMLIFEIYEWQLQISNRGAMDINKFEICWEKLQQQFLKQEVQKLNCKTLLNQKQIENIQIFLKNDEFISIKSSQALRSLRINLQKLWSVEKYDNMMKQINLNKLVETPYMMEIIVQVLPEMMMKATEIINLKQNFIKNFQYMLKEFYKSNYMIQMYKQKQKKYLIQLNNEIEKSQQDNENENEKLYVIVKKQHKQINLY